MAETEAAIEKVPETKPENTENTPTSEASNKKDSANVPAEVDEPQEVTPELQKKIVKQLDYYFGDFNLPRDRFLRTQTELEEGWVPLDVMLKFSRLNSLTKQSKVIVEAMEAVGSDLLELSEDKNKVRRVADKPCPVLDEALQLETQARTVYCKGFPEDATLDAVMPFFEEFGKIQSVMMRTFRLKNDDKTSTIKFKGSVFTIFTTLAEAEAFMKLESVKYKDEELIRKWQKDYNEEKKLEREQKFDKGKKKPAKKEGDENKEDAKEEEKEVCLPTGCFLHITNISGEVKREDLRAAIQQECESLSVAFIDFNKGDTEAWVRLQGKDTAAQAVEQLGGKLTVCDLELIVAALSAEDEQPHIDKAHQFMKFRNNRKPNYGRGGGRRGNKRRGGYRGRGGFDRSAKRARTDGD